ncbi:MAG: PrsW family intramembrane metalloprotease [Bacteroidetes bacterium]|nr:PrsW family intramembrane metalloprotease [Bacteroidota bacterium]
MVLFGLSIAPGIAISLFIIFKDSYNKEPRRHLLICFVLGVFSTLLALGIEMLGMRILSASMAESLLSTALEAFLVVAFVEEWSKYLMVKQYAFRKPEFDEPFDGIVYSVMVSMGFATLENILYVMQHGMGTAILRMFLSVPAHACFGIVMGYYLGKARFTEGREKTYIRLGLLLATLFHGFYDFFLFLQDKAFVPEPISDLLLFGGAIVSYIIAIRFSRQAIRDHLETSRRLHT